MVATVCTLLIRVWRSGFRVSGALGLDGFLTWQINLGVSENRGYLILGFLEQGSYHLGYYIRVPYFRKPPFVLMAGFESRSLASRIVASFHAQNPLDGFFRASRVGVYLEP